MFAFDNYKFHFKFLQPVVEPITPYVKWISPKYWHEVCMYFVDIITCFDVGVFKINNKLFKAPLRIFAKLVGLGLQGIIEYKESPKMCHDKDTMSLIAADTDERL